MHMDDGISPCIEFMERSRTTTYGIISSMLNGITPENKLLWNYVMKNVIPMSRIVDTVKRILRVKFKMGLFKNPMGDKSLADELGSQGVSEGSCKEITCATEER